MIYSTTAFKRAVKLLAREAVLKRSDAEKILADAFGYGHIAELHARLDSEGLRRDPKAAIDMVAKRTRMAPNQIATILNFGPEKPMYDDDPSSYHNDMDSAIDAGRYREAQQHARRRVAANPNDIDAHEVLGAHAPTPRERVTHARRARALHLAAPRSLFGPERNHRTRLNLALALRDVGDEVSQNEALDILEEILAEDLEDYGHSTNHRGYATVYVRLAAAARQWPRARSVALDLATRQGDCESLMDAALYAFAAGDASSASAHLRMAHKDNRYIVAVVAIPPETPVQVPSRYLVGGIDEAIAYQAMSWTAWNNTPGAIAWLFEEFRDIAMEDAGLSLKKAE